MARTITRPHLLGDQVPLWVKMIRERYEDGKRIISVDTADFGQVLDQVDNYRVEIEAPKEVFEAFGIMDSAEKLGVDPDGEGLPPEAYERGRWN